MNFEVLRLRFKFLLYTEGGEITVHVIQMILHLI